MLTTTPGADAEPLLDVGEVARWLKVSPRTIYRWAELGYLPHVKLGNRLRFTRRQVEDFIKANLG